MVSQSSQSLTDGRRHAGRQGDVYDLGVPEEVVGNAGAGKF